MGGVNHILLIIREVHACVRGKVENPHTFLFIESTSMSAFLAHFCQNSGSSRAMSVRFSEATKLALEKVEPLPSLSMVMVVALR